MRSATCILLRVVCPAPRSATISAAANFKGKFAIKLGPMAASFGGDVAIERKPDDWTAIVSGKGADQRSGSRASGSMTYRLSGGENGDATRVDVASEINLAGALAQFGKAGVIQEVASRLTNDFVRNFEAKLEAAAPRTGGAAALEWHHFCFAGSLRTTPTHRPHRRRKRWMREIFYGRSSGTKWSDCSGA